MKRLQVQVEKSDAQAVDEIARRLQVPGSAAARMLLRAGLEAARRDFSALLAAPAGDQGAPAGAA